MEHLLCVQIAPKKLHQLYKKIVFRTFFLKPIPLLNLLLKL